MPTNLDHRSVNAALWDRWVCTYNKVFSLLLTLLCIIVKIQLLSEFITFLDRYLDVLYRKAELAFGFYFAQVGSRVR